MLTETFKHCRGIASVLNQRIIKAGCHNWFTAINESHLLPLPAKLKSRFLAELNLSQEALYEDDIAYLVACFPTAEKWRILAHYWNQLSFLDIETTGLSPYNTQITVAALWHQGKIRQFVKGHNLPELLPHLEECELLVTFCGGSFDLPRVMDFFHIPEIPCPHIDLRWQFFHHGLTGGLKRIEQKIGFKRPPSLIEVDGLEAVELWQRYRSGEEAALPKLLAYVSLDVLSLRLLTYFLLGQKGHFKAHRCFQEQIARDQLEHHSIHFTSPWAE